MSQNITKENTKKSNKIWYALILSFVLSLSILFMATPVYATQTTDVTLDASQAEDVWAVVIGISDYGSSKNNLHGGPVNSAKMVNSTLVDAFGWPNDHISLLLDEEGRVSDDVTKEKIIKAIDWLHKCEDKDDMVLFYFGGHGSRNESGEPEYIVPNRARDFRQWFSDHELASLLSKLESKQVIVILDSCFSGGFAWDGTNPGDLAEDGRIILAACKEDESSYTVLFKGDTEWNELFTWCLVKGFKYEKTVEEAFHYAEKATAKILEKYGKQMHPQMYDGLNPPEPWNNLIGIGVVIGITTPIAASALVVIKKKREQPVSQPEIPLSSALPTSAIPAYICPVCNQNLTWIPQYQHWYCFNCQRWIN